MSKNRKKLNIQEEYYVSYPALIVFVVLPLEQSRPDVHVGVRLFFPGCHPEIARYHDPSR